MTFELTRIKQRLADLEKGYKELSIWHDKNKRVFLELNVRSKKHQQDVLNIIQLILADPEVSQEMVQSCFERAFGFLNLEMQMHLDKKNTGKDHP